jgi:hypothetical protein
MEKKILHQKGKRKKKKPSEKGKKIIFSFRA